jgi:ResB-like family
MTRTLWKFLSSLRLTVVCLALSIVLVFIGTIAQADEGLYQAQLRYFKQWLVWGPMLFGHQLPILLPGGYLLGTALVVNLLTAHVQRFVLSWRKLGIHMTHLGIVLLLLGQLATDMLSEESHMRLVEGETRNYIETHRAYELVFIAETGAENQEVVSIPESMVAHSAEIVHEKLPFTVRIKEYQINSEVVAREELNKAYGTLSTALATLEGQYSSPDGLPGLAQKAVESPGRLAVWQGALKAVGESDSKDILESAKRISAQPELAGRLLGELKSRFRGEMLARFRKQGGAMAMVSERMSRSEAINPEAIAGASTQGAGAEVLAVLRPETKAMDQNNLPYAVVEILEGGKSLGTWLMSPWLNNQTLQIGGKSWRAAMRGERQYQPFSVKLLKTTHEVYRGTDIPKNFKSRVLISHPARGETRETDIYMNNPLRYEGLTFFQYQMGKDERAEVGTSTLQVVRNPSWLTPYIGCILVALGMIYQFLFHLVGFITKRRAV